MPPTSRAMPRTRRGLTRALIVSAALTMTAAGATAAAASPAATTRAATTRPAVPAAGQVTHRHACAAPARGRAACLAIVDANAAGRALTRTAAAADGLHAYMAADLRAAYKLSSVPPGAPQTIAIVDAYDDPNAAADLAAYRAANGLPPCTSSSGCFRNVNQKGGSTPPAADAGWALEESLDLDMASAACPTCHILLVEANNNTTASLGAAEDKAAALGANVISNSWGAPEYNTELPYASHFHHPGIAITASSGDWGFGVFLPAVYSSVTAVGGTTLYRSATPRGWAETAWQGAGSGCSAYVAKPSWQKDRLCGKRTVADVAAVADPNTPVAVYDTYSYGGWVYVGGTSVASPLIAGVYALAGNTAAITPGGYLYAHHRSLFDVTSGSNGDCGGSYLCTAVKGYDGPTGWGTPDGTSAF